MNSSPKRFRRAISSGGIGLIVSSLGRVKLPSGVITFGSLRNGYRIVVVQKKSIFVHRLICEAFYGPPENIKKIVHHKDGNKQNNNVENLEWVFPNENVKYSSGYQKNSRQFKQKVKQLKDGKLIAIFTSLHEAQAKTGVSCGALYEKALKLYTSGESCIRTNHGPYTEEDVFTSILTDNYELEPKLEFIDFFGTDSRTLNCFVKKQ